MSDRTPKTELQNCDCLEFMKSMPDKSVDLVLTDPPYGVNLGNHVAAKECRTRWLAKQAYSEYEDTYENYLALIVPRIKEGIRIGQRAIVFCAGTMMWDLPRPDAVGGVYLPAACGRNCWGFNGIAHCLFYGKCPDLNLGSKRTVISSTEQAADVGHPCPKPDGWMKWLVDLGSRPNETVFDPFMGSGTTGVACKLLRRNFIGCEISKEYYDLAKRRIDSTEWGLFA